MSAARTGFGWMLATAYIVFAGIAFGRALTCSGWVCDLVALPAIFPLGVPFAWFIDWLDWLYTIPGHTRTFHLRNW